MHGITKKIREMVRFLETDSAPILITAHKDHSVFVIKVGSPFRHDSYQQTDLFNIVELVAKKATKRTEFAYYIDIMSKSEFTRS